MTSHSCSAPTDATSDTLHAAPHQFDVVIVDEASQATVDWITLLWLAPRVLIIGDQRQCTPGQGNTIAQHHHDAVDHHLAALPKHQRGAFLPASNLYELMASRTG
jgi:superfamily I DNA and/or RNA helicase